MFCFSCTKIHDRADQKLFWRGPKISGRARSLVRFPPRIRFAPPISRPKFLWEKVSRKILQENPPKFIQQTSPTHFCRGAVPRSQQGCCHSTCNNYGLALNKHPPRFPWCDKCTEKDKQFAKAARGVREKERNARTWKNQGKVNPKDRPVLKTLRIVIHYGEQIRYGDSKTLRRTL